MKKIKELTITTPWGHVAAKTHGQSSSYPVLCIHGILDNAGAFDRLIAKLPDDYYYIAVDLPGHGLSSHFSSGLLLDFFNYVLTIRYIVEYFKWEHFYYVGHSFGGQLGAFYSILYPSQIKKMVLIEGLNTPIVPITKLIPRLRTINAKVIESTIDKPEKLFTKQEIMHSLMYKRSSNLNKSAAEALFPRAVTQIGSKFKYNRDLRLKSYVIPMFDLNQILKLLQNLNTDTLLIMSFATIDRFRYNSTLKDALKHLSNIKIEFVCGNHDVHNNQPENLVDKIVTFFCLTSKL
ncbi:serine hydrolase-like protein [Trichogramma pretiosum]|uniref:serine hydrolase-like protein n=1 Tax=Trichogramma pretiosum TaxID=7493 RepID=UPI0006C9A9FE|nr:serine hydrolase-like protein [Trichogramma pretiosum]XP_023314234.1 serine hydrolase-like protein [Trichogramma pretiosum]